jgi:NarL family two-component system response regulator LiaR
VGEVSDGLDALRCAQELQPEVILLDMTISRLNGIQVARQIPSVSPPSIILFVTLESNPEIVREGSGASGYIFKPDANEMLNGIDCIRRGEQFLSSSLIATAPELMDIRRYGWLSYSER